MSSLTEVIDQIVGQANPGRPTKGVRANFVAESTGPAINKKGFGLVGVSWPALAGRMLTFHVSLEVAGTYRLHSTAAIDMATAGATSLSDLAEWPFIKPVVTGGNITDSIDIALS